MRLRNNRKDAIHISTTCYGIPVSLNISNNLLLRGMNEIFIYIRRLLYLIDRIEILKKKKQPIKKINCYVSSKAWYEAY